MKKNKKEKGLDLLFDWFVKTEQSEELRQDALESVGMEYKLLETTDDTRRQIKRTREEGSSS